MKTNSGFSETSWFCTRKSLNFSRQLATQKDKKMSPCCDLYTKWNRSNWKWYILRKKLIYNMKRDLISMFLLILINPSIFVSLPFRPKPNTAPSGSHTLVQWNKTLSAVWPPFLLTLSATRCTAVCSFFLQFHSSFPLLCCLPQRQSSCFVTDALVWQKGN